MAPLLNGVKKVTEEPHKGRPVATLVGRVRARGRTRAILGWGGVGVRTGGEEESP